MLLTKGRDFDEVFARLSRELITAPVVNPRQLPTREVLGATFEIANSEFCILRHPRA